MTAPRAVVFGEALIDVYPEARVAAGAPLHVAVHLAARGWTVSFVTRVGDDPEGARIRDLLEDEGVDSSLVETDRELATGEVTIELRREAHSFTIHGPAAWDAIEGPDRLPAHDAFYFGTLAARAETSRDTLARLLAQSDAPLRALDVNLRHPHVDASVLALALGAATLLKTNEEELREVARALDLAAEPAALFDAAPALAWVCVTSGERGADLHARSGEKWSLEGAPVEVVDTVGAGDAFVAALVDALVRGREAEDALQLARAAAASVLGRRGGLPPRSPDV
ncbi:MAG: PfkB family carbohydrate kinase [Actinomycetota bacterium]|nr:PfkB family carbohydrate kinase [Actinomycetota bacterium]